MTTGFQICLVEKGERKYEMLKHERLMSRYCVVIGVIVKLKPFTPVYVLARGVENP